ncbi:epididymal-specific lipocalin-6 isoform X6 [Ovis canadensis]|uniref:epididymal-specific lipocalin-6 isoform X6 n=1 Tax=Ovis canadensis TaxID=37174 RepID=UPI00375021D1
MHAALLAALLAVVSVPSARAVWLGRLDPQQLMGSWYVLAVASGGKDFALERATRSVEGVEVMLTSQNTLKMRASRHRLERCHLQAVELRRQNSGWVFGNPSLGVLEYRVLGTNFRDYAIVFTQLEAQEEAFSTVELYSECTGLRPLPPASSPALALRLPPGRPLPTHSPSLLRTHPGSEGRESWACRVLGVGPSSPPPPPGSPASPAGRTALASQEALGRFAKWSRSLGFLSQQQAELQRDFTCARKVFPVSSLPEHPSPLCGRRCLGVSGPSRPEALPWAGLGAPGSRCLCGRVQGAPGPSCPEAPPWAGLGAPGSRCLCGRVQGTRVPLGFQ